LKEDGRYGACRMHGRKIKCVQIFERKMLTKEARVEDLVAGGHMGLI
jgi:hypothetical protein